MALEITTSEFDPSANANDSAVAVLVLENQLDRAIARGAEQSALEAAQFEGKVGQTFSTTINGLLTVVIGAGSPEEADAETLRRAAGSFSRTAANRKHVVIDADFATLGIDTSVGSQAIAEGFRLGLYKYVDFKSSHKDPKVEQLHILGADADAIKSGEAVARAVSMARDLINGPPSVSTPSRIAEVAQTISQNAGLSIRVLDEHEIEREGLGGLLGVSRGSDEPPRLIELTYEPSNGFEHTLCLVGKGITFDSGGLSLKPAAGMMTMKTDMSGAAAVLATMSTFDVFKPKCKVVAFMCATENLPGPKATKPGDVLRARNGKTMEVLNTDAEGRLVLADGLSLAVEAGADAIVDVATLTGACVVALGTEIAGLMTNNDEFGNTVKQASERAGEEMWKLPLPKRYRKHIDSEIADIKNIGAPNGAAGTLSAGLFLQEFVGDTPWVHLDIAGPARAEGDDGYVVKGGTGFATRTLIELIRSYR